MKKNYEHVELQKGDKAIKLTIHGNSFFFLSVKHKLCSGLEKAWGLSSVLISVFACFEFDSGIYCNFYSFLV